MEIIGIINICIILPGILGLGLILKFKPWKKEKKEDNSTNSPTILRKRHWIDPNDEKEFYH